MLKTALCFDLVLVCCCHGVHVLRGARSALTLSRWLMATLETSWYHGACEHAAWRQMFVVTRERRALGLRHEPGGHGHRLRTECAFQSGPSPDGLSAHHGGDLLLVVGVGQQNSAADG